MTRNAPRSTTTAILADPEEASALAARRQLRAPWPRGRLFAAALGAVAAILSAVPAGAASAEVARRELASEIEVSLELRSGRTVACGVRAWSGAAVEGTCGSYRWEDLSPTAVLRVLRAIVAPKDAPAARDAAAVLLSFEPTGSLAASAIDMAKRAGASGADIEAARAEAVRLAEARREVERAAGAAALTQGSPEGQPFSTTPWPALDAGAFERSSASALESARALLAAAGTSAALHEQRGTVVLAEQSDDVHREDAVELEAAFRTWAERFAQVGLGFNPQGRIPIVIAGSRDAWRVLLASATNADAAAYPDVLVVYRTPRDDPSKPPQAIVLVAPNGDHAQRRYHATVGLARAMLHYATSAERPPGWINEGLPRVIADLAQPKARMDIALRQPGLDALRGGMQFAAVLNAGPGDACWQGTPGELPRSLSYLLARRLYEQDAFALLRAAKPVAGASAQPAQPAQPAGPKGAPAAGASSAQAAFEARFRKSFGVTLERAVAATERWYQTND